MIDSGVSATSFNLYHMSTDNPPEVDGEADIPWMRRSRPDYVLCSNAKLASVGTAIAKSAHETVRAATSRPPFATG